MMENHIPASVLDAENGFSAVVGGDGSQFLFSVGSDSVFRASVDSNGGVSSWVTQDIAAALCAQLANSLSATVQAKTFAVSYAATTDSITIVLVLSQSAGGDLVYVAYGLPASAGAAWLSQISWQAIPFDSTAYTSITPQTLDIGDISLQLTVQSSTQEPAQAFATVIDPSNQHYRVFTISIPQTGVPSVSPAWASFTLPVDSSAPLQTAPGQPVAALGQGIYLLASIAESSALQFMPSDGAITISYAVPDGSSAITSLALPDSGASTLTELYVAGANTLTLYPAGAGVPGVQVCSSSYISGTSVLHVVSDYGDQGVEDTDAIVAVWGLNANGQIFFTYAPYTDRQDPTAWSAVVVLMAEVSNVTPLVNSTTGALGFLGICSSPVYTATTYGPPASSTLVHMYSDPVTLDWQSRYIPVPSTGDYIRLQSYTSTVRLIDPATNLPLANTPLNITTTTTTNFIVNGQSVSCPVETPSPVTTDVSGSLTIINTVSGISAVPFTISDAEGDTVTLMVNSTVVAQPYDPTGTVTPALQQGITGDLTGISYQNSDGTTSPLVSSSNPNLASSPTQIHSAFAALSNQITAAPGATQGLAAIRGNALTARVRHARSLRARRAAALDASGVQTAIAAGGDGVELLLADLAQWVVTATEDVENLFINVAGEVVTLVVTFAEGVFNAVVTTVEDALNAVVALFKYIGAEFEEIFRWLAFIFNWREMVEVHDSLSTAFQAGIAGLENELDSVQAEVDAWFKHAETALSGATALDGATPTVQSGVAGNQPGSPVVGGSDISSDPRVGWIGAQLKASQQSSLSAASPPPSPADSTLADTWSGFGSTAQSAGGAQPGSIEAFGSSASGTGSTGSAASGFMTVVGETLLADLQNAVDDGFTLLEGGIADAGSALTATITVPVLSGIYYDVVNQEPSILDIACLCMAVPMTICYNIAASSNSQLPPLSQVVEGSAFQSAFANFFAGAGAGAGGTPPLLRADAAGSDSGSAAALAIIGGFMVLQGYAIAADYIGEDSGAQAVATIATIVEELCDFGVAVTADSGGVGDTFYADFVTVGAGVRLMVLIGILQAVFLRGGLTSDEAAEISLGGKFVDTVLGVWALVEILEDVGDSAGEDWVDMFVDLLAFPGALLAEGKVMPYAPIVASLRALGAEALGIMFLNAALAGSD